MAKINVYPIPHELPTSPYLDQLYRPMQAQPDLAICRLRFVAAVKAMLGRQRGTAIAHWHFFDELTQRPSKLETAARTLAFLALLRLLKLRGVKLCWTAHNIEPHELRHPGWAQHAYRGMIRRADAIIAHSQAAADLLRSRYAIKRQLAVIPHGAYIGLYGPRRAREPSREQLGLAQKGFVALNLGTLRPYKGLELLIEAWQGLDGQLLIAGQAKDSQYAEALASQAVGVPGVQFRPKFIPDDELPTWLAAADVVVLPYRKLLTSGILLWALSYGVPLVAPDVAPVRELVQEGHQGFLFEPESIESLRAALRRARAHPDLAALGDAAYATALPFAWDCIARQTLELYRRVAGGE